ncbi:MAG: hypothetical protein J6Y02_02560 [Pseudobutyrivibrio sp.]|nr:hypothetical protein [Pseudobutyrivibrio sp.]
MTIELDNYDLKFFEDCVAGKCFSDATGRLFIKIDKKSGYICDTLLSSAVDLSTGEVVVFKPKTVIAVHENARVIFK